jgi:glycosyltransferase involved in cell wall biosynthesis
MQVVYAPVDTKRFRPDGDSAGVREEFGVPAKAPVIGIAANICPGKGQEYFLEAARTVKFRYPEAKFLVVGGRLENREQFWSALIELTAKLGLQRDVFFTGRRDDVPQVLRAMTVCVQASESEACPMAMLEAMSSGVPVVATNVGGTPELVVDGETGLLIEPRRCDEIAAAVLRLLDAPSEARRMGLAGARRMREHFSLEKCVEAHCELYSVSLVETKSRRVPAAPQDAGAAEGVADVYTRN